MARFGNTLFRINSSAFSAAARQFRSKYPLRRLEKFSEMHDPVDWSDPQQVKWAKWLALQPTPEGLSFLARHILGFNWWNVMNVYNGPAIRQLSWRVWWRYGLWEACGLVPYGEHRRIANALVSGRDTVLLCTRNGNKTTWGVVRVIQSILQNPSVRWLIYMATQDIARDTLRQIRRLLESKLVTRLFGEQKGDEWSNEVIRVAGAPAAVERNPTVAITGTWATDVGTRCDNLWVDDPIDPRWVSNPARLENAISTFQAIMPLKDPGGVTLVTLTPYADGDFSSWLLQPDQRRGYRFVISPSGMEASYDERGRKKLTGFTAYPRLTRPFLLGQLKHMSVEQFNRSYALMLQDNSTAAFRRQDFVACRWEPRMANMQAYVVTDTATSDQASACLTVAAVVAIDWDRTCYVIDMVCGRWMPSVALDEIARLFIKWKSHMRGAQTLRHLHSIAMEKVTMNSVYRHGIEEVLQKRGHHADIIELPRGASSVDKKTGQNDTKALRIRSLEPVVRAHKLRMVVDTMTPLWDDRGTERPIYAERGFTDQHGAQLPGGELVDEFVRWRDQAGYKGLVDIPDALSALTQTDARGDFLLQASPRPNVVEQRGLRAGDSLDRVLSIQPQAHPRRTSFFDRLLNQ